MTPERWRNVNRIFHAALEYPESESETFLRHACDGDDEMYSEVRRMLQQSAQSGPLDHSPLDLSLVKTEFGGPRDPSFAPGQTLAGRYRVVRFIAHGGMGEVYEVEDLDLGERLALKTLRSDFAGSPEMIARFKREIQLSRRIASPYVCRVHGLDLHRHESGASVCLLTMELLSGQSLANALEHSGSMPLSTALPLIHQIASALDAAHRAGIIHRDLKPSNVLLVGSGAEQKAVVADFGLARDVSASQFTATGASQLMGTMQYMAPELFDGTPASVASDVYAFGILCRKLLAAPHSAAQVTALSKATDSDPAKRFSSAGEFAAALAVPRHRMFSRRAAVWACAALGLVVSAFGGWRYWPGASASSPEALEFYRKGVEDIEAGAWYAATLALSEAVRVKPGFALAHARLAEAWNELSVTEKAKNEIIQAQSNNLAALSEADRIRIEAVALTIVRKFPDAVSRYEALNSKGGEVDMDLARAYEKATRPKDAESLYRRAAQAPAHNPAGWLHLAVIYSRAGRPEKNEAFQKAEDLYRMESNLDGLTQVALQRGVDANRHNQFREGAAYLRTARDTARLAKNPHLEIVAGLQSAMNSFRAGDLTTAEQYANEAISLAHSAQMELLTVNGLLTLGSTYKASRSYPKAEGVYREALAFARQNNAQWLAANALFALASLHNDMNRSAESEREAREALGYYDSAGFTNESSLCWTLIGRQQRDRGDMEGALASFRRVLQIAESAADRPAVAIAHASLGSLFSAQDNYPEALKEFQREAEAAVDDETIGYAALQSADAFWRLGRYKDARSALDVSRAKAVKFPTLQIRLQRTTAEMELSQLHYSSAAALATSAMQKSAQEPAQRANAQRILCLAQLGLGQTAAARKNCDAALDAALHEKDAAGIPRAMVAAIAVRLAVKDASGAAEVLSRLRQQSNAHPESRFQAAVLTAAAEPTRRNEARQAFEDFTRGWPQPAVTSYQARPDVQRLLRPVLETSRAGK